MVHVVGQGLLGHANEHLEQLFESLVADEERHFDLYDKQLDNIKRFGPTYLAMQSFGTGDRVRRNRPPASSFGNPPAVRVGPSG